MSELLKGRLLLLLTASSLSLAVVAWGDVARAQGDGTATDPTEETAGSAPGADGEVAIEVIVDDGYVAEELPVGEDPAAGGPAEEFVDGGIVIDDGVVLEDGPVWVTDGEVADGEAIDPMLMMQSGVPTATGEVQTLAPATGDAPVARHLQTDGNDADTCVPQAVTGRCIPD